MIGEALRLLVGKVRDDYPSLTPLKEMFMGVRSELPMAAQKKMLSTITEKESELNAAIKVLRELVKELEARLGDAPFAREARAPYANMTQVDAVKDVIQQREMAGESISTRDVYDALVKGKYPFRSKDAIKSLSVLISKNMGEEWERDDEGNLRVIKK